MLTGPLPRPEPPPRAGFRRPHQFCVRARPNCQCATSMGDARMSQRPWGRLQVKQSGGTDDVVSTLARTPRTGTRFDSNSSPPCSLQPRLPFSVKRTNVGRVRLTCLSTLAPPDSARSFVAESPVPRLRTGDADSIAPCSRIDWSTGHCPVTMIFDFPAPAAGGAAEPGVQIGEPPPPPPESGVQISPRAAATPSSPAAVVTRGPN